MKKWRHLDLFSGIGGNSLAVDWVWPDGVEHIFCEIDPFCRTVLKKHWPEATIYEDITKFDATGLGPIKLITGGFPCQPFSDAGHKRGKEDDRDLWPEMFRIIKEARPVWVVGENVAGFVEMELDRSISDLESAGYSVQVFVIPAMAVDARHRRDRVWIVAHADSEGYGAFDRLGEDKGAPREADGEGNQRQRQRQRIRDESRGSSTGMADASSGRRAGRRLPVLSGKSRKTAPEVIRSSENLGDPSSLDAQGSDGDAAQGRPAARRSAGLSNGAGGGFAQWAAEPRLGRVAHGIPNRVDRIKSLGNSIVPQVAAEIFAVIKEADTMSV